jgi:hypothetical protein
MYLGLWMLATTPGLLVEMGLANFLPALALSHILPITIS